MISNLTPKGMRDFLPQEKDLREYVSEKIKRTYTNNGFSQIETSQIENIENMLGADAGDNVKLIFKIMKRGEKLDLTKASSENDLADLALRFDLTLPLSRFYANNRNDLPQIFKAFQMGYVFRAERPQKGRYRSFVQCDIDIIGDETNLAEIELILTVYNALVNAGLSGHKVIINDRRILKAITSEAGFTEKEFEDVAITLDKLDKIGKEGVIKELQKKGYQEEAIHKLNSIGENILTNGIDEISNICPDGHLNLKEIMDSIRTIDENIKIEFDHSLVRGMGYYTSTIFEIKHDEYIHSIGGGGRYDEMIGSLSGVDTAACGFSIGYERLVDILSERNIEFKSKKKIALIFNNLKDSMGEVIKKAQTLRKNYDVSVFNKRKKFKRQADRLKEENYDGFIFFGEDEDIRFF